MIRDTEFSVGEDEAGLRIERLLVQRCPGTTRSLVLDAIERGGVTVNGLRAAKGMKPGSGARVAVRGLLDAADRRAEPDPSVRLEVIFEDTLVIVLNKQAGIPVHPLRPGETGTLAGGLVALYPDLARIGPDPMFPALAHRLDAGTSGAMIAAKTSEAYESLRAQFAGRLVSKEYAAIVAGEVSAAARLSDLLVHARRPAHRMRVVKPDEKARPEAMRAVTEYEPVERFEGLTLLRVTIHTGVTHQIRCQLANAGLPIAGDGLYGGPAAARMFLHAAAISFLHPASGDRLEFRAPFPADFAAALDDLREGRPIAKRG
ncbi:MAG: RluA family pseudouridine synthase [Lentisphaerae bacterium]|nr:RluA family pseudouridine synthase [Lentisphaerota bacterium]